MPQNGVLYLVPQSLFKLHPDNDRVFVDVLQRDKDASLVFFNGFEPGVLRVFRERLSRALREAEIPVERALFLPMRPRQDYLQVNLACDIMLDSLHWSGGNTTLDALHAALPVLTAPGRFMRGRQSMAMLQRLDCNELIAESPRELALRAVDLAHSPTRRIELASRIRHNLPTLTQSDVPLQALDDALKRVIGVDELGR